MNIGHVLRKWGEYTGHEGVVGNDPVLSDSIASISRFVWPSGIDGGIQIDLKRLLDIVLSVLLLLITLPLTISIAIAIWVSTFGREPILYRQQRVGLNGKLFTLVKFRSMQVDAEPNGAVCTTANDPRITAIGKLIRRKRIDELPQLLQVLSGNMSLVGPRPERPEFVRLYNDQISGYFFRHGVKPGLTGWAQVNYGYGETVEDAEIKLYYDLNYVMKGSLWLDLLILWRTLSVVTTGWGAR
jgi:lipopolysaccharide/colanic/teichoic acid biosynthesis glycosyltransferase